MLLADWQIEQLVRIEPMAKGGRRPGVISYGIGSYGYDCRVGTHFRVFRRMDADTYGKVIDPKAFDPKLLFEQDVQDFCVVPPNSYALAETVEAFEIPRNVLVVCVGKSTYARCGLIVNVTPLEPEWRGKVTLEISNSAPLPAKVYANEGIAQLLFLRADAECRESYADKAGVYQDQRGLTLPIVR